MISYHYKDDVNDNDDNNNNDSNQGCISCGPCSYPELTEDHVLPSA